MRHVGYFIEVHTTRKECQRSEVKPQFARSQRRGLGLPPCGQNGSARWCASPNLQTSTMGSDREPPSALPSLPVPHAVPHSSHTKKLLASAPSSCYAVGGLAPNKWQSASLACDSSGMLISGIDNLYL